VARIVDVEKRSTASRARSMIAVLARAVLDSECGLPNTPVRKRRMCARTWDTPYNALPV
jgi:hypothetical protein